MKENNRQKKINQLLQEELSIIFQRQSSAMGKGILITVTDVKITADLSISKVYLSIFPQEYRTPLINEINILKPKIRKILGTKLSKQLRQIPQLSFYLETSLDEVEKIEKALKGEDENPIR
ncbi:30S ribosome-binding factor RbfA [Apibacter adventoris]|uniref:30S ribosome-binding factor RbfA n=1 Tax=Apibacter adventoris TaxID=1679466 RepID=UPI000CF60806|nr:30S ribosome-binding factor RbfA [Apibacter adventoris]PQL94443.1 30S ribosome-binding factor RbfA [Apibacter adventoris]